LIAVGKTRSRVALMKALQRQGHRVAGMKPEAAGCDWIEVVWRNEDALVSTSRNFDVGQKTILFVR